jgi:hypothetical protein
MKKATEPLLPVAAPRLVRLSLLLWCIARFAFNAKVRLRVIENEKLINILCKYGGRFTVARFSPCVVDVWRKERLLFVLFVLLPKNVMRHIVKSYAVR